MLFVVVMQEATKEARREGLKELLYADDLELMAESEEGEKRSLRRIEEVKGLLIIYLKLDR